MITEVLNMSRNELMTYAATIQDSIENGDLDPVQQYVIARKTIELCNLVKSITESFIYDTDYTKKDNNKHFNVRFEQSTTGDRFNYEENEDYKSLKQELKSLEQKIKNASKNGAPIVDNSTGELIEPVSLKSPSKTVLKATIL